MKKSKKMAWYALLNLIEDPDWELKPEKVEQWKTLMAVVDPEMVKRHDERARLEGMLSANPGLEDKIVRLMHQKVNNRAIKSQLDVPMALIAYVRKKHQVARSNAQKLLTIDKETLEKDYSILGTAGVAKKYGVSETVVYENLRKYRIKRKSNKPTPVKVIFSDGSTKAFNSMRKAAAEMGITVESIRRCIYYQQNDREGNRYALLD